MRHVLSIPAILTGALLLTLPTGAVAQQTDMGDGEPRIADGASPEGEVATPAPFDPFLEAEELLSQAKEACDEASEGMDGPSDHPACQAFDAMERAKWSAMEKIQATMMQDYTDIMAAEGTTMVAVAKTDMVAALEEMVLGENEHIRAQVEAQRSLNVLEAEKAVDPTVDAERAALEKLVTTLMERARELRISKEIVDMALDSVCDAPGHSHESLAECAAR